MVVLLRVGIGWHFLYEGIHKFYPVADFSAEGFLGIAKGPTAEWYYWMLPDLDGIQRLEIVKIKDENDKECDTFVAYENAWKEYFRDYLVNFVNYFPSLTLSKEEATSIVEMNAAKLTEWVAKNATLDEAVAKDIVAMTNASDFSAWAAKRVVLNKADAEKTADMNATKLAEWARQVEVSDPSAVKEVKSVLLMNAAQLAEWALKEGENDSDAVRNAKKVAKMDALQLAEWANKAGENDTDAVKSAKKVAVAWNIVMAKTIFNRYLGSLRASTADEKADVEAFKASRDRFLEVRDTIRNDASFEQERRWQNMMKYRAEAATWTRKFDTLGNALQSDLGRLADPQLAGQKGQIVTAPEKELLPPNPFAQYTIPDNPYVKSRMEALNLSVIVGLTAIGLCLMLGFCTRLACLGGAAFLINVVLTTYPVPGVYPAIPTMVGNFMFVSKDVVELLALLVLALVPAGRWGGLDYFLWHYGGKQIVGLFCFDSD